MAGKYAVSGGFGLLPLGYLVVIAKMPFNLAIFGVNRADGIIAAHPEVGEWSIGGFSLGGVAACMYLAGDEKPANRLVLYASYTTEAYDLSGGGYRVKSITGSNDGLSTPQKIADTKQYLPPDTVYYEIKGGDHTGFALYGGAEYLQKGDNPPGIPRMEQQEAVVEQTLLFLETGQ